MATSYVDLKNKVDEHYGPKCHDCDEPAVTYYIDPDNPIRETRRTGRLGWEFYFLVIEQEYPDTVLHVCRRHYLNRYQNDGRRMKSTWWKNRATRKAEDG